MYAANHGTGQPWVPSTAIGITGPQSYEVSTMDGLVWRKHIDQLRQRALPAGGESTETREELSAIQLEDIADEH